MEIKHILEAQQFDKKMLKELFTLADRMEEIDPKRRERSSPRENSGQPFLCSQQPHPVFF